MALFATLTFMHVDKVNSGRKVINLFRVPKIGANFKIDLRNRCQTLKSGYGQRYTFRVLQTSQMKLILLCVWAESAVLGSTKATPKFKQANTHAIQYMAQDISAKSERKTP